MKNRVMKKVLKAVGPFGPHPSKDRSFFQHRHTTRLAAARMEWRGMSPSDRIGWTARDWVLPLLIWD